MNLAYYEGSKRLPISTELNYKGGKPFRQMNPLNLRRVEKNKALNEWICWTVGIFYFLSPWFI
jgi:hypothetical protein